MTHDVDDVDPALNYVEEVIAAERGYQSAIRNGWTWTFGGPRNVYLEAISDEEQRRRGQRVAAQEYAAQENEKRAAFEAAIVRNTIQKALEGK